MYTGLQLNTRKTASQSPAYPADGAQDDLRLPDERQDVERPSGRLAGTVSAAVHLYPSRSVGRPTLSPRHTSTDRKFNGQSSSYRRRRWTSSLAYEWQLVAGRALRTAAVIGSYYAAAAAAASTAAVYAVLTELGRVLVVLVATCQRHCLSVPAARCLLPVTANPPPPPPAVQL